jgi:MOSC domain-containing protein YiiM
MSQGFVEGIYTCENAGEPMTLRESVELVSELGIVGDRYHNKTGKYSNSKTTPIKSITFIELEAIEAVMRDYGLKHLTPAMTRRNVVTRHVALNHLVGRKFFIQSVSEAPVFRGIELCEPCARPGKLLNDPKMSELFETAFKHRGGLRAEVVRGGKLSVGEIIVF